MVEPRGRRSQAIELLMRVHGGFQVPLDGLLTDGVRTLTHMDG
jgi:hypothetical protein